MLTAGPQLQEVLDALNDVRAAQQASDAKLASFEQQVTAVLTEQFASVTAALNAVRATLARPGMLWPSQRMTMQAMAHNAKCRQSARMDAACAHDVFISFVCSSQVPSYPQRQHYSSLRLWTT